VATVGGIVGQIRDRLMGAAGVVDELIVMDSHSVDDTGAQARAAGAQVWPVEEVRPDLGSRPGKGEAVWKSLFVSSGDLLVYIDADLSEWGPHFVTGLLGPLLTDPQVRLVRGFYDRVLDNGSGAPSTEGGRVTELVARPLLNLRWPDLAAVVQPLAGEWAIRRATIRSLPVPVGYGVEMSTLLDVYHRHGLAGIAQVDLGRRAHRHQSVHDLGVMASEILRVADRRSGLAGLATSDMELVQFDRAAPDGWRGRSVPVDERPPAERYQAAGQTGGHA
jgi:glucosyl-3-phosphoglycerate synthase